MFKSFVFVLFFVFAGFAANISSVFAQDLLTFDSPIYTYDSVTGDLSAVAVHGYVNAENFSCSSVTYIYHDNVDNGPLSGIVYGTINQNSVLNIGWINDDPYQSFTLYCGAQYLGIVEVFNAHPATSMVTGYLITITFGQGTWDTEALPSPDACQHHLTSTVLFDQSLLGAQVWPNYAIDAIKGVYVYEPLNDHLVLVASISMAELENRGFLENPPAENTLLANSTDNPDWGVRIYMLTTGEIQINESPYVNGDNTEDRCTIRLGSPNITTSWYTLP